MKTAPIIRLRNAQRMLPMDTAALERFAVAAFSAGAGLTNATRQRAAAFAEISIVLVSDRRMATLHRQFMNIAGPTDVLTFQHGEIVLSVETAQTNGRRFQKSTEEEVRLYILHGFLHLLGFDDQTTKQARVMASTQTRLLRELRKR